MGRHSELIFLLHLVLAVGFTGGWIYSLSNMNLYNYDIADDGTLRSEM